MLQWRKAFTEMKYCGSPARQSQIFKGTSVEGQCLKTGPWLRTIGHLLSVLWAWFMFTLWCKRGCSAVPFAWPELWVPWLNRCGLWVFSLGHRFRSAWWSENWQSSSAEGKNKLDHSLSYYLLPPPPTKKKPLPPSPGNRSRAESVQAQSNQRQSLCSNAKAWSSFK